MLAEPLRLDTVCADHRAAGHASLIDKLPPLGDGLKQRGIGLGGSRTRSVDAASTGIIIIRADRGPLGAIGVSFE